MNLSFLPGELHLYKSENGQFIVKMAGKEILSTKSQRAALAKFNALRTELEARFPAPEPTAQEKAELLQKEVGNSLVGHNSLGGRKKKTTAGGTRTFGG
jgi:hypothetical protein